MRTHRIDISDLGQAVVISYHISYHVLEKVYFRYPEYINASMKTKDLFI